MLETFKAEVPSCSFEQALLVTSHQRNRLSSVKGSTPATLAFGYVPSEGGVMDSLVLKLLVIKLIYPDHADQNNRLQSPFTRPTRTWH